MHYKQRGASFFYILFLFKMGTKMQNTKVLKAVGSKCYLSMEQIVNIQTQPHT